MEYIGCPGTAYECKNLFNDDGICVNKRQVEGQLKGTSVFYQFDTNYSKNNIKIKRCEDSSRCDFKEEMADLKLEMATMKRQLIIAIRDQSKNCRPKQYVGQWNPYQRNY